MKPSKIRTQIKIYTVHGQVLIASAQTKTSSFTIGQQKSKGKVAAWPGYEMEPVCLPVVLHREHQHKHDEACAGLAMYTRLTWMYHTGTREYMYTYYTIIQHVSILRKYIH